MRRIDRRMRPEGGKVDARLWELAENLHRAELTVQQRAEALAEWIEITDARISFQVGKKVARYQTMASPMSFVADAWRAELREQPASLG
jgi:hypothetical protein